jgi:hypothetical protein
LKNNKSLPIFKKKPLFGANMKKRMMIISLISLSFLLSDLSFAKKKRTRAQQGVVGTTVKETGNVAKATGKAAVDIVDSVF